MHTTLNILKVTNACTGGYGRMITFFGDRKKFGDQIIPLHVVSLVGGADDAQWALHNSAVIDEEKFKEFYRQHMPSVLKHLLNAKVHRTAIRSKEKNPILAQIKEEALKVQTFEECEAWLKKARTYNFSNAIFESVLRHRAWTTPATFISYCMDHCMDTFWTESSEYGKAFVAPREENAAPVIALEAVAIPFGEPDAENENNRDADADDEEGEAEDSDGWDGESDEEDDRPRRAVPAARRTAMKKQTVKNTQHYWFKTSADGRTKGQQVAYLFSPTPFDFVHNLEYKTPKGVKLEKKEDGRIEMKLNISQDEKIYQLLRTITTKMGDMADADQE